MSLEQIAEQMESEFINLDAALTKLKIEWDDLHKQLKPVELKMLELENAMDQIKPAHSELYNKLIHLRKVVKK